MYGHRFKHAAPVAVFTAIFLLASPSRAIPVESAGSGYWTNAATWVGGILPDVDDEVVIAGSHEITLDTPTPSLASLTVTNATLTATHWTTVLSAGAVLIQNGGVLTHLPCDISEVPENTNRVHIVCESLMIDAGGKIDTTGRGFAGGSQPDGRRDGQGPGGGKASNLSAGGGSYGGLGGRGHVSHSGANPGALYGVADDPFEPGSGGGAGNHSSYPGSIGGSGGGAVKIAASGKVTVNGAILADGLKVSSVWGSGGGSGGGVSISCDTMEGHGLISADGSDRQAEGGGGGGGRIAIHYHPVSQQALVEQPDLKFSLLAFRSHPTSVQDNQFGTLWLNDDTFLPNRSAAMFRSRTHLYGVTNWVAERIAVTNTAIFLEEPGVAVTVAEDLAIGGAGAIDVTLSDTALTVGGNVSVREGGFLRLRSGPTNGLAAYGGLVSVAGDLTLGNASILYLNADATNGGALKLTVDRLEVLDGAQINADGTGFRSGTIDHPNGFGPGGGVRGDNSGGGGGHGGAGGRGRHANSTGGIVNGDPANPTVPGSGGGDTRADGSGGGVIWIESATSMQIDGIVSANGSSPSGYAGGGSGGGILLKTPDFLPTLVGMIRAEGGTGGSESGGGGGGRIAMLGWTTDRFDGVVRVAGGAAGHGNAFDGEPGSLYRATDEANEHTLHVVGVPQRHAETVPYDYGMYGFADVTPVSVNAPLTAEQAAAHRFYLLGYTLTNRTGIVDEGHSTQAVFTVESDLWLNWNWTNQWYLATAAGDNGSLLVDKTGWYTNADSVTVEAVANEDHAFLQWAGTGVPFGRESENPIALNMSESRDIQAVFVSTLPVARDWNGNGNWLTPGNWTPEGIPGPNDDLTIQSGTVWIGDPVSVGQLTVSNHAAVVFTNWTTRLSASHITVRADATITHASSRIADDPGNTNRVYLICETLTVMAGGTIDVCAKGFGGGVAAPGEGPGGGPAHTHSASGGGYGGIGGAAFYTAGGIAYGTVGSPNELGSGGGGRIRESDTGGAGGGLVRVEATGTVTIDGEILANGENGISGNSGGGSGGGIAIHCSRLAGSGLLIAMGGEKKSEGGAGAGGRIAVIYDTQAQAAQSPAAAVRMSVRSWLNHNPAAMRVTQAGTVYLTDDVILPNAVGAVLRDTVYVHNVWQLTRSDLTVRGARLVLTPQPGFKLAVDGDLLVAENGGLDIDLQNESLDVQGDLTLTNSGSSLTLYCGPTNGFERPYGARVAVGGMLRVGAGCTVTSHGVDTNGAAVKFEANDLVVAAGGLITADGFGLRSRPTSHSRGLGFFEGLDRGGGGYGKTSGGGGGHGGRGGRGNSTHGANYGGYTYASSNQPPVYAGSAGGSGYNGGSGGRGGGLIWVEAARSIRIDGTISARGGSQVDRTGGAGSGGGIWLVCRRFEGDGGLLRVDGGNVTSGSEGGGGGGGRILVFRTTDTSSGIQTSMLGGTPTHYAASPGEPGTVAFIDLPPAGTLLLLR